MKKSQLELVEGHDGEYLYSKPGAKIKPEGKSVLPRETEPAESAEAEKKAEQLHHHCSRLLNADAFLSAVSQNLAPHRSFCALVFRVDKAEEDTGEKESDTMLRAARALESAREAEGSFFGLYRRELLAAVFPGMDDAEGLELAVEIQQSVKKGGAGTVSAGVAQYPNIEYKKNEILDNCVKALEHAAYFGPNSAVVFDAVSLNISGDTLYQKGDIAGAIAEFQRALRIDPENVNVHNSLGVCHAMEKEYEKAMAVFKTCMKIDPEDVMLVYNAGLVELHLKNTDKALEYFRRAEKLDGEHFEAVFQIGRIYLESGKHDKALSYLEKAVSLAPDSGPAHRFLGECHVKLENQQKAIRAYSNAIKINAYDAASLSALGGLYAKRGENLEIAHLFCRQSVQLAPETGLFRYRFGQVLRKQEHFQQAREQFEKAAELGHEQAQDCLENYPDKLAAEASRA